MDKDYKDKLLSQIIAREDRNGCWNVLEANDTRPNEWNYYVPNYKSTLWTLLFIADINSESMRKRFMKPLGIITDHFFNDETKIFSIGKSHFPIPCLNGNMLYLHNYFDSGNIDMIHSVIDFFHTYQRFDDGDYKTPTSFPYLSNKSCYGKHSCYWGVVKLFKGLSFLPKKNRYKKANELIGNCIDFILKHQVCYSSTVKNRYLQKNIEMMTFPTMYASDFLEILWLLKREGVHKKEMEKSLALLKSKRDENGTWEIEKTTINLAVPFGKRTHGDDFITERAQEVYEYYF